MVSAKVVSAKAPSGECQSAEAYAGGRATKRVGWHAQVVQRVWCGSGLTSKEACSEIRNATAFSWLGDAAESPGLDELVPCANVWKEALLLVRARHTRHRSSSVGERRRSRA